uniref:RxLR effector protein n=1 Tax=Spongospora subterranea TaxID=70186 RepID=A0A0H5QF72_9EUKA|eukprot:CRZ00688.1 hypothetical protein [Spongospora subterranea]
MFMERVLFVGIISSIACGFLSSASDGCATGSLGRSDKQKELHTRMKTIMIKVLSMRDSTGREYNDTAGRGRIIRALDRIRKIERKEERLHSNIVQQNIQNDT